MAMIPLVLAAMVANSMLVLGVANRIDERSKARAELDATSRPEDVSGL